jgi:hypothetical protein
VFKKYTGIAPGEYREKVAGWKEWFKKHLSYGKICRGQVFLHLLQVCLSGSVGKSYLGKQMSLRFSHQK